MEEGRPDAHGGKHGSAAEAGYRGAPRRGSGLPRLLLIFGVASLVLALLPGGCVAGAAYWYSRTQAWIEQAERVSGEVVGHEKSQGDSGPQYAPIVTYEYEGEQYEHQSSVSSSPKTYEKGEAVAVYVDPADPTEAMIDRWSAKYLGPVVLGGFGLTGLLVLLAGGTALLIGSRWANRRAVR